MLDMGTSWLREPEPLGVLFCKDLDKDEVPILNRLLSVVRSTTDKSLFIVSITNRAWATCIG